MVDPTSLSFCILEPAVKNACLHSCKVALHHVGLGYSDLRILAASNIMATHLQQAAVTYGQMSAVLLLKTLLTRCW